MNTPIQLGPLIEAAGKWQNMNIESLDPLLDKLAATYPEESNVSITRWRSKDGKRAWSARACTSSGYEHTTPEAAVEEVIALKATRRAELEQRIADAQAELAALEAKP